MTVTLFGFIGVLIVILPASLSLATAMPTGQVGGSLSAAFQALRAVSPETGSQPIQPGRPTVVFFFCGCLPCHAVASQWTEAMEGESESSSKGRTLQTVIAFAGSNNEAKQFLQDTGIDKTHPIIRLDGEGTLRQWFHVQDCPQVFVIDKSCHLVYSTLAIQNTSSASSVEIVSRTLTAVRALQNGGWSVPPQVAPQKKSTTQLVDRK